jgi:hypothetical protein
MFKHSLIALAALGAGLIGFSASEGSAMTITPQKPAVAAAATFDPSLLTEVRHNRRHHRWDRYRHGNRWHRRTHRYRHYHRGYWYENPWWILPMVGAGIALSHRNYGYGYGYGSSHVEWCLNRYRSYNPRTNTWVSYSGYVRQCVSPYGP